jgi:hypothetical protein
MLPISLRSQKLYCPKCKAEYSHDITQCAVCEVSLVDSLTGATEPADEPIELLKTPDIALLMVVKSVLESAGIPFWVRGEEALHVLPLSLSGGFFNATAYGAVVLVRREDLPDASKLLAGTAATHEGDE